MQLSNNQQAFLALVRAGLWEIEVRLTPFGLIDFEEIFSLADEQSLVGLVAAGIEHITDVKPPQDVALQFVGATLQLEQRNKDMNSFLEKRYGQMQKRGIYSVLMKGQGIAQCYERPLWRTAGDIDLLLIGDNYDDAKEWLSRLGVKTEEESWFKKHLAYKIEAWDVELHGTLRGELGGRIDKVMDEVQNDIFYGGNAKSWMNGKTQVFIPAVNEDVVFVFAHILQHYFRVGVGLRQICDWCRLLWTCRETIDVQRLEQRLKKMRVITEWKAFAAFAVDMLGMPADIMPLYSTSRKWSRKAKRICSYVLSVGNFGQNRDVSYKTKFPFFVRIFISFYHRTHDFVRQFMVFPMDALRTYFGVWKIGVKTIAKRML